MRPAKSAAYKGNIVIIRLKWPSKIVSKICRRKVLKKKFKRNGGIYHVRKASVRTNKLSRLDWENVFPILQYAKGMCVWEKKNITKMHMNQ